MKIAKIYKKADQRVGELIEKEIMLSYHSDVRDQALAETDLFQDEE